MPQSKQELPPQSPWSACFEGAGSSPENGSGRHQRSRQTAQKNTPTLLTTTNPGQPGDSTCRGPVKTLAVQREASVCIYTKAQKLYRWDVQKQGGRGPTLGINVTRRYNFCRVAHACAQMRRMCMNQLVPGCFIIMMIINKLRAASQWSTIDIRTSRASSFAEWNVTKGKRQTYVPA